MEDIRNKL